MRVEDYPDLTFFFVEVDNIGYIFATLESSLSLRAIIFTFPKDSNVTCISAFRGGTIDMDRRNSAIALAETHTLYRNERDFKQDYLISKITGLTQ